MCINKRLLSELWRYHQKGTLCSRLVEGASLTRSLTHRLVDRGALWVATDAEPYAQVCVCVGVCVLVLVCVREREWGGEKERELERARETALEFPDLKISCSANRATTSFVEAHESLGTKTSH